MNDTKTLAATPMTDAVADRQAWERMAQKAYKAGHNGTGHRFSAAAALTDTSEIPLSRLQSLERDYRAWSLYGEFPEDGFQV